jgi:hypothetical protein
VSRLSNDVVRLRVVPDSACAALSRGWWRPRVVARAEQSIATMAAPADGGHVALDAVIDAALRTLAAAAPSKAASLDVELADSLVHLDVVAGDFVVSSHRELATIATACVEELLGDAAKEHEIRWQLQRDGRHLLIGAVARSQLQMLTELAKRHGMRLRSVQPDFCLQWNRHARLLRPGGGVFVVASGRDAVVSQVDRGTVRALSGGPWLDRRDTADTQAQRLVCGPGLERGVTTGALDLRVDRMLTGAGLRPETQASYVLVAPQIAQKALAQRWHVVDREVQSQ